MTHLEEIKERIAVMKHWHETAPDMQTFPYMDGPGPDMEWLVLGLEKAIEMAKLIMMGANDNASTVAEQFLEQLK